MNWMSLSYSGISGHKEKIEMWNWDLFGIVIIALPLLVIAWWLVGDPWLDRLCAKDMDRITRNGEKKYQLWLVESRRVHKERMLELEAMKDKL